MSTERTPDPQAQPRPLAFALARYGPALSPATRRLIRVELSLWCNAKGTALAEVFEAQSDTQEVRELQSLRDYLDRFGDSVQAVVLYGPVHKERIELLAERYGGLEVVAYRAPDQVAPPAELLSDVIRLPDAAEQVRRRTGSRPAIRASHRRG